MSIILDNHVVTVSATGNIAVFTSLTFSRNALKNCTNGPLVFITGVTNAAPILAKADFTFAMEPFNVSFAFFACSPNALSIADAKVLKSISPLLVISRTSASDLFKYLAKVAAAFIPLPDN